MPSGRTLLEPSRRRLLSSVGIAAAGGLAGCAGERSSPTRTPTAGGDGSPALAEPTLSVDEVPPGRRRSRW